MEEQVKKKVMVAIDESECSRYALIWTLENLGDTIRNSELVIFTVQPLNADFVYTYGTTYGATPPGLVASVLDNHKKVALDLLDKAKEICSNHGIVAETVTEVGCPKQATCEAVEKLNIQLLIIGSQSQGVLQRAFVGSVSDYCVQYAKCSVLVVRKPTQPLINTSRVQLLINSSKALWRRKKDVALK